jgi:hypothetical protein
MKYVHAFHTRLRLLTKYKRIAAIAALTAIAVVAAMLIASTLKTRTESVSGKSVIPKDVIETFEISALEYSYSAIIFERNTAERKFLFIRLEDASQIYAVQFDGAIKLGVNGKDVQLDEQLNGESKVLTVTIPKAHIISHDAPLNDTAEVIFDVADHTEQARIGQYIGVFNDKKKEIEADIEVGDLLERAQQSAKKQLESLLNAIPDIRDNYELVFVLA